MRKTAALLIAALILFLAASASAEAALYRVTKGDGGECFLMGTIHVGRESDERAMEKVFRCLEECGVLVTEVEISQVAETGVASLLQAARYFLPLWESLEDRLGKETVAAVAARFHMPEKAVNRFTPAFVEAYFESLSAAEAGLGAEFGTEMLLYARMKDLGAVNEGIETAASQMDLALSLGDGYMKEAIRAYLEEPEEMRLQVLELHTLWENGDAEGLTAYIEGVAAAEDGESADVYRRMFVERNRVFADRCLAEIASGRRVLVAVGCGHLYGKDGVIRLLEEAGCEVTPVE